MAGSSDFGGAGEFSGRHGLAGVAFEQDGVLYDANGYPISEQRFSPYVPYEPRAGAGWDPTGQSNYAALSARANPQQQQRQGARRNLTSQEEQELGIAANSRNAGYMPQAMSAGGGGRNLSSQEEQMLGIAANSQNPQAMGALASGPWNGMQWRSRGR